MFEYLPQTEQNISSENKRESGERSLLTELVIFRTAVAIAAAVSFLVLRLFFPAAADNIAGSFRRLSSSVTSADSEVYKAAQRTADFFMDPPPEVTEHADDRA